MTNLLTKPKTRSTKDPKTVLILRAIIGTVFILAGLEATTPELNLGIVPESAEAWVSSIGTSSYFIFLIYGVQVLAGTMLIFNFLAPFALLLITPIVVNIILYSMAYEPGNLWAAAALTAGLGALYYYYRNIFKIFFKMQVYSDPMRDETSKVIILEEAQEKFPKEAGRLQRLYEKMN